VVAEERRREAARKRQLQQARLDHVAAQQDEAECKNELLAARLAEITGLLATALASDIWRGNFEELKRALLLPPFDTQALSQAEPLLRLEDHLPKPPSFPEAQGAIKPLWKQGGESTKRKLPNMRLASRSASGASPTSPSDTKRSAPGCNAKSRSKTLRSTRLLRPIEPLNRPRSSATLRPCLTWMSCQRDFPRHSEWRLLPNRSSLS